jgi:glycosyltransferase involved in cell wall biosynthesis
LPRFSIVIPSFNAEATLSETLESVEAQGYGDWECLVVDDGSTDGTAAIARRYAAADPRVRVLSQENMGTAGAYNMGVRAAVGEFVVILSADDILLPQHLSGLSGFIDGEPSYDIYSTNGFLWRPDGSREMAYPPGTLDAVCSLTLADVIRVCFYSVGAAYRRRWFERIGGYRLGIFGEDYDFWLRAMANGATHRYLPMPLSLHRLGSAQKSASVQAACRSDIRAVKELGQTYRLTDDEIAASRDRIAERKRAIRLDRAARLRWRLRSAAARLLGEARAQRLVGWVRSGRRS